ncbi:MAG: hypothetical protein H6518_07430 [Microthrixaceae bacterium]|nr:hypothetical protein [Microthrixaceae bacterium]
MLEPNAFHGPLGRNHLAILALADRRSVDVVDATLLTVGLDPLRPVAGSAPTRSA